MRLSQKGYALAVTDATLRGNIVAKVALMEDAGLGTDGWPQGFLECAVEVYNEKAEAESGGGSNDPATEIGGRSRLPEGDDN